MRNRYCKKLAPIGCGGRKENKDSQVTPPLTAEPSQTLLTAPFPFLELPIEVRNQIYKHAIVSKLPIRVLGSCGDIQHWRNGTWTPPLSPPALTQASKQLHSECKGIYYGHNTFAFTERDMKFPMGTPYATAMTKFQNEIHVSALECISTVCFEINLYRLPVVLGGISGGMFWKGMNQWISIAVVEGGTRIEVSSKALLSGEAQDYVRGLLGLGQGDEVFTGLDVLRLVDAAIAEQKSLSHGANKLLNYPLDLDPSTSKAFKRGKYMIQL
ncbi:hypothetical protein EJ08DRAFT_674505 [Tothia fuscella]|uniref:Uncharacterized protein n=1 Tax=Tothia fuscella TaxID=1048955 RepID=A0A9P4U459_9PEZI|nr:hypothetical protein EJ08DRAFT_674505 [Tothia fuscella]